jgi:tRNA-splicing ligase RtcB
VKPNDLVALGLPLDCVETAYQALRSSGLIRRPEAARDWIVKMLQAPETCTDPPHLGDLARAVIASRAEHAWAESEWGHNPLGTPSGFAHWGERDDQASIEQMNAACQLPVAVQGALMPDNHLGYGLPIGGVLATYNSVIPYAVGVDIACRMMCTITDLPAELLDDPFSPRVEPLVRAIAEGTVFGMGGQQKVKADHPVMDRDWTCTRVTRDNKDKAWAQLGTSGSGNHFVEFGVVTFTQPDLGLEPGRYVALLSHSGSRGAGAAVCKTYNDIAMSKLPRVYERFKHLAWLSLDSEAGQEYWQAMNLMGEYASANHHTIHRRVLERAGAASVTAIENHHNFAWKEEHGGRELIVHRKGATPAGAGVLGVIPGSMADPAFIVRGKGQAESLRSASHGAGRKMSRTQAINTLDWAEWQSIVRQRGVRLLSAGLDEVPGVYKDIRDVMAQQTDLVDVVARFEPKLVKMSDDGKAED